MPENHRKSSVAMGYNRRRKNTGSNAFKKAVESTPEISGGYRAGLQALKDGERGLIDTENTLLLEGSVDIDACTRDAYPEDARWDYAIGYDKKAYFVEIHPGDTSNVSEMISKANWLKNWLKTKAPALKALESGNTFYWIPSGRCKILPLSPQYKKLAQSNILIKSRFKLPVK